MTKKLYMVIENFKNRADSTMSRNTDCRSWRSLKAWSCSSASTCLGPLTFGTIPQFSTSAAQSVTLSNTGTASLNIFSANFTTGTNFGQTNNCGSSVIGLQSCIYQFTATPQTAAALTDTFVISTSAGQFTVYLSVTGTATINNIVIAAPPRTAATSRHGGRAA